MSESTIEIIVDGERRQAEDHWTVAAALMNAGITAFRLSEDGAPRAPFCGMGICFECRVTIDGVLHQRACMMPVRSGMRIDTARHP